MLNYTNRRFLLFSCLFLPDFQYLCSPKGKIKRAGHDRITTQNNALNLLSTEDFFMTDDKKQSVADDSMDRMLHDETRTIRLELAPRHNTVQVGGQVLCNGQPVQSFNFTPRQLLCVPCRLYAQNRYKDCKHAGSRTKAAKALYGT